MQKIEPVDKTVGPSAAQTAYVQQRARGAYIASICQPEAAYDLSVAAQAQRPTNQEIDRLNKRLEWQKANPDRGLTFAPLDLARAKLFIFADASFANNRDLSSQIGFLIVLAEEEAGPQDSLGTTAHQPRDSSQSFALTGNILHWTSMKCKRVTRSVLASEIYGLVAGYDAGFVIASVLTTINSRLRLPPPPVVVCTDSYSLYECLVKMGSTTEKRLMIDLLALRQSYERREIDEVRWIDGRDNPADALTKSAANDALKRLVDGGRLQVRVEAWVDRKGQQEG